MIRRPYNLLAVMIRLALIPLHAFSSGLIRQAAAMSYLKLLCCIALLSTVWVTSLAGCSPAADSSAELRGRVVRIADGDSFTILGKDNRQQRIRLYGIDCPENGQPYSKLAKQALSDMIFGREPVIREKNKDRYGRIVALVYIDGININEAMLKQGWAWHFKRYDSNRNWDRLEKTARKAGIGLWADPHPVAPWKYRQRGK